MNRLASSFAEMQGRIPMRLSSWTGKRTSHLARTRPTGERPRNLRSAIALGLLIVCAMSTLPACKIPNLRRAQAAAPLPATFEETSMVDFPGNTGASSAEIPWCEFFSDPILVGLIQQAFQDNLELKILAEDIRKAQYLVRARSGAYLPFFNLGGGAGIAKPSLFTPRGAVEDQLQPIPGKGFPNPLPNFLVAGTVSWEIDIWKKLRNSQAAAAYRYLGTAEGRNYTATRLIADIAENYYRLLALDNRLMILDRTIEIQQKSLETTQMLKAAGRATELGVQRFEAEVRRNQSEKLIVQQEIVEVENKINFSVGRYPQFVERANVDYLNLNLGSLSAGVPSQLLRNRADIRQAERNLAAAGLDVTVARARFFPSLVMTAGVGYEAFNTRYLFNTPESLIYGAAGELVGPIINRRAIEAEYQTANAEQLQSIYEYQRTVLNAFTEVVNYLNAVENYGRSIEIKRGQLQALETSVDVATDLFQNLRSEYIDVLLAQRDMMEARTVLVETKQMQLSSIVNAYQALGGGGAPTRSTVGTPQDSEVLVPSDPTAIDTKLSEKDLQMIASTQEEATKR